MSREEIIMSTAKVIFEKLQLPLNNQPGNEKGTEEYVKKVCKIYQNIVDEIKNVYNSLKQD